MIYAKTPRQCERREKDAVTLVLGLINAETDGEALDVDIHAYMHTFFVQIYIYDIK